MKRVSRECLYAFVRFSASCADFPQYAAERPHLNARSWHTTRGAYVRIFTPDADVPKTILYDGAFTSALFRYESSIPLITPIVCPMSDIT